LVWVDKAIVIYQERDGKQKMRFIAGTMSGEASRPGKLLILAGWVLVGCVLLRREGPPPLACLRPQRTAIVDFFQDWASAKLFLSGKSVYAKQQQVYREHISREDNRIVLNQVNAHPPPAILLILPLGLLDYPDACLVWNLLSILALGVSLALILVSLRLRFQLEGWVAVVVLLGWCFPLWDQLCSGQFNLVLLLLITLAWVFERSGRLAWAGVCLGSAAALKLIPGFLFLYFLVQGRWRALLGGLAAGLCWVALSAGVLGGDVFVEYVREGLPQGGSFRDAFPNVSLAAFWTKLFAGTGKAGHAESLWDQPGLARVAIAGSWLVLAGTTGWLCWKARTRAARDQAFGLSITAMLLLSPTTWPHYLLLLLLPVVLLWRDLPSPWGVRCVFWVSVAILCLRPYLYWGPLLDIHPNNWYRIVSKPWQTLTLVSLQMYALLGVFCLGVLATTREEKTEGEGLRGHQDRE
jgi:alpha-1,2-mannosyltransferase